MKRRNWVTKIFNIKENGNLPEGKGRNIFYLSGHVPEVSDFHLQTWKRGLTHCGANYSRLVKTAFILEKMTRS